MANGRTAREIKRVRNEILVALKVVYPGALPSDVLLRSLLVVFPTLEFDHLRRDLCYLSEKGYLERVITEGEEGNGLTPWRRRWLKLTVTGVELADHCINDPAMEEGA